MPGSQAPRLLISDLGHHFLLKHNQQAGLSGLRVGPDAAMRSGVEDGDGGRWPRAFSVMGDFALRQHWADQEASDLV